MGCSSSVPEEALMSASVDPQLGAATSGRFVLKAKFFSLAALVAFAAFAGIWAWQERHPFYGDGTNTVTFEARSFDAASDCQRVHNGPETECGGPWAAPCFDRGRCNGTVLSVYVHDTTCSMKGSSEIITDYNGEAQHEEIVERAVRDIAATRGLLVETPEDACIIFYPVPKDDQCVSRTPTWRKGQNHVLLDFKDKSRESHQQIDEKAMFASSNMRGCFFRYGYDIAVPLRADKLIDGLRETPPLGRKYFATFKGTLKLSGNGMRERNALLYLTRPPDVLAEAATNDTNAVTGGNMPSLPHLAADVVVVERCATTHQEQLLPENKELCQLLEKEYDEFDYDDLMNTTFALIPSGRSPATLRLGEALSAGALPVFIHQDFVKPFPGLIPWPEFSFSFPAEEVSRIVDTLRAVPEDKLAEMQETALQVFDKYFGPGMNGTVHTILDILEDRLFFRARRRER